MKKTIAIMSLIFAILMFIFSLVMFFNDAGTAPSNLAYGGDAYTGIQNAAAATARNVKWLNEAVCIGFGAVLLGMAFGFIILSLYFFMQDAKEKECRLSAENTWVAPAAPAAPVAPATPAASWTCEICGSVASGKTNCCVVCGAARSTKKTAPVVKDGWRCSCGKVNPKYMSTCTCGKSAREVREKNTELKGSLEEKAIASGVCPDCGAELEKSDIETILMCPDCGRMFG